MTAVNIYELRNRQVIWLVLCCCFLSCSPEPDYEPLPDRIEYRAVGSVVSQKGARRMMETDYMLVKADIMYGNQEAPGKVILFRDKKDKHVDFAFSPHYQIDSTARISYHIDLSRTGNVMSEVLYAASVREAMHIWEDVPCSSVEIGGVPSVTRSSGYVAWSAGFPGDPAYMADINHAGFMPGEFFNLFDPNGAVNILGITFTIAFRDAMGNPMDLDEDGRFDVAFREIYYNAEQPWNIPGGYDFLTLALHETGHGLGQEHFGKAFLNRKTGKIQFAPRALMNASYSGEYTTITGTDRGSYCSFWSKWPNTQPGN